MEEIIKTLLLEGIDEDTIHRVLDVIEEEYEVVCEEYEVVDEASKFTAFLNRLTGKEGLRGPKNEQEIAKVLQRKGKQQGAMKKKVEAAKQKVKNLRNEYNTGRKKYSDDIGDFFQKKEEIESKLERGANRSTMATQPNPYHVAAELSQNQNSNLPQSGTGLEKELKGLKKLNDQNWNKFNKKTNAEDELDRVKTEQEKHDKGAYRLARGGRKHAKRMQKGRLKRLMYVQPPEPPTI